MSNATTRPTYIQEAKAIKSEALESQELHKFLQEFEGHEAQLQGQESIGLKRVIVEGKLTKVTYFKRLCTFKKDSLLSKAWHYGAGLKKWELEVYLKDNN